jgi:hypothetical protein
MRASSIITTLLLLLATSCSNDTTRYDAGVSRELAEWRKETISELKYNIDIDLVENIGKVDIEFAVERAQEIVIDFRATENILAVERDAKPLKHRIESEHRWLKGKKIIGIADPAIWDAETGESIADTAAKHQVFFSPGDHKRIPGWMQCHYRLAFDQNGFPMFCVFSNCKQFIRTIPLLQYDEHKPEDVDTDGEDHIADAWRYFLMSRPIKPRVAVMPDEYSKTPMAMFLDIPKEDIKAAPKRPRMRMEIIDE